MGRYQTVNSTNVRTAVFSLGAGIRIGFSAGGDQTILEDIGGPHRVVRVGAWLVERMGGTIGLRRRKGIPEGDELHICFQRGDGGETADVRVIYFADDSGTPSRREAAETGVREMVFTGGRMDLLHPEERAPREPSPGPQPGPSESTTPRETDSDRREYERLLEEGRRREAALQRQLAEVTGERDRLRARNQSLEARSDARLEEFLMQLQEETDTVNGDITGAGNRLVSLQKELERLRGERKKAEEEVRAAEESLSKAKREQEELREKKEILELDTDKALAEIRVLKERQGDDLLTAQTIADDALIGTGSVMERMRRISEELEQAEKKIGAIVRFREGINDRVQNSVVRRGTEFLTAVDEMGK